jgi:hypothetical protein
MQTRLRHQHNVGKYLCPTFLDSLLAVKTSIRIFFIERIWTVRVNNNGGKLFKKDKSS